MNIIKTLKSVEWKWKPIIFCTSHNVIIEIIGIWFSVKTLALFQYPIRHLIVRSKVSNLRDYYLELCDHSEIWQAPKQHCRWRAWQISKRFSNSNYQSHIFETLRDVMVRCLIGYWKGPLIAVVLNKTGNSTVLAMELLQYCAKSSIVSPTLQNILCKQVNTAPADALLAWCKKPSHQQVRY